MEKLLFIIMTFFIVSAHADINGKKHILILHSYSQEYGWTKLQHNSFVASLERSSLFPIDVSVEYLDTKRLQFTDKYQDFFLHYLQEKYKGYAPDAIYVTDDNALTFFSNHKNALFADTPIFFSGINNLSLTDSLDPMFFTGVYETKEIEPNIELIRQFSPQTREIWIIGDGSTTYQSIEADIKKKIYKFPKYTFHFLSSNKINDVIAHLPTTPKSFVLLTTIGAWSDYSGKNLTLKESIGLLKHNPHLILCSMEDAYMVGGVVGGFVTSGAKQGSEASALVSRYFSGESLRTIHSIVKSPNVYMFDNQAVVNSRLILSEYTARNAVILHRNKSFFEKYQYMILNVVFILILLFLIFLIIVYFITLQRKTYLRKVEAALEERSAELSMMKEKLALMEQPYE